MARAMNIQKNPYEDQISNNNNLSFADWLLTIGNPNGREHVRKDNIFNKNNKIPEVQNNVSPPVSQNNQIPNLRDQSDIDLAINRLKNNTTNNKAADQFSNITMQNMPVAVDKNTDKRNNNDFMNSIKDKAIANLVAKNTGSVGGLPQDNKIAFTEVGGDAVIKQEAIERLINQGKNQKQIDGKTHEQRLAMLEPDYMANEDFMITY